VEPNDILKQLGINRTFQPVCHQSSLKCYLSCKRKFLYCYLYGLHPARPHLSPSLTVGKMVHSLLYHGPDNIGEVKEDVQESKAVLTLQMNNGQDPFGDNERKIEAMEEAFSKSVAIAKILWEKFPPNPDHVILSSEKYLQTTVDLGGFQVPIAGKLDRVIFNKKDGTYYIRDYKTTSRDVDFTLSGYRWSAQPYFYKLLAEHNYQTKFRGFILDIIQIPTIKMCGKDKDKIINAKGKEEYVGEPLLSNYIARCKAWYEEAGQTACRSFCEVFPADLSAPSDILSGLNEYSGALNLRQPYPDLWPRDITGSHCKGFNRQCEYYSLCNLDPSAWPVLIEKDYTVQSPDIGEGDPSDPDE
jgi:hypothetical protein